MESQPKISLIIPVYNAEKYLRPCLDSILSQTLNDIEVICINDCSPDSSGSVLDEYAMADRRVKVLHKTVNQGPMSARADGYNMARGEYFFFCDSDDYLPGDALASLYAEAQNSHADITVGNMATVNPAGREVKIDRYHSIGCDWHSYLRSTLHWGSVSMCGSLFQRNIFTDNSFTAEHGLKQSEDRMLLTEILISRHPVIAKIDKTVYYYRVNNESTTRSVLTVDSVLRQFDALFRCYEYVAEHAPELSADNDNFIVRYLSLYIEKGAQPKLIRGLNDHSRRLMRFGEMRKAVGMRLACHTAACINLPGYRFAMHELRNLIRRLQGKD